VTRRGGAYVLVVVLSAIVAVLGTGGLLLRDRVLEKAGQTSDAGAARTLARSSAEIAIQTIIDGFDVGSASVGAAFVDTDLDDGSLQAFVTASSSDRVTVRGRGRIGGATALLDFDVVLSSSYRTRALGLSPNCHWPLDETDSNSWQGVQDAAGPVTGIYSNIWAAGDVTGPDGEPAPWFDSKWDSASFYHYDWMETPEASFAMWVFTPPSGHTGVAFSKGHTFTEAGTTWIYFSANNAVASVEDRGEVRTVWWETVPETWVHVTVTAGATGLVLYLDGREVMHNSAPLNQVGADDRYPIVGAVYLPDTFSLDQSLNGSVRELSYFTRTLTSDEVASLVSDSWTTPTSVASGSWRWSTN